MTVYRVLVYINLNGFAIVSVWENLSICVWVQVCAATMRVHILGINVVSKFDAINMTVVEGRFYAIH